MGQIENKEVDILNIEIEENADIDINACSNSIIKFDEKLNKNEIEKEENKNNNLNIISNQQFEINNEEKKNNQKNNNIESNNLIINDNNIQINKNQNNLIIHKANDLIPINIQKENNFNMNNINNQNNSVNLNNQTYMVFPYNCNLCNQYPIVKALYYCLVCGIPLCQECEEKLGINHRHSILKVQTKQQYDDLEMKINRNSKEMEKEKEKSKNNNQDNSNQSGIEIFANNIKDSIIAFFGNDKKDENINNIGKEQYNNQRMEPQKMSLLQLARAQYDLNGISDAQLQEAIQRTNGNIDEAIVLLMS